MTRQDTMVPLKSQLKRRISFSAKLGMSVCALALMVTHPTAAQDAGSLQTLNQKLERLQGELNDLQRAVYRDEVKIPVDRPEPQASASAGSGQAGGLSTAAGQRIQQRISSLEADIRRVTGQMEETRYKLRQTTKRMDKLVADVDYRLQELETFKRQVEARLNGGESLAGADRNANSGDGGSGAAAGSSQADAATKNGSEGTGASETGSGGGTLGQVSKEAVADIRKQANAENGSDASDNAAGGGGQEANAQSASADAQSAALPDDAPKGQYDYAFGLLRQSDYDKAEKALKAFVENHPEHALAGNAKYWLGETHYVRGNFEQAAVTFAEGFRNYPDSRKAPDNLLKLGMSLGEIGKTEQACQIFSELEGRFPDAAQNILQRATREQSRLQCGG